MTRNDCLTLDKMYNLHCIKVKLRPCLVEDKTFLPWTWDGQCMYQIYSFAYIVLSICLCWYLFMHIQWALLHSVHLCEISWLSLADMCIHNCMCVCFSLLPPCLFLFHSFLCPSFLLSPPFIFTFSLLHGVTALVALLALFGADQWRNTGCTAGVTVQEMWYI